MEFHHVSYIAPAQCQYTLNGVKLVECRKAKLLPYADALGIKVTGETSKNELVKSMIAALDALGAPDEIGKIEKPKKKIRRKAKKKKK